MDINFPSKSVQKVIDILSRLPGIGQRTALRLALYMLNQKDGYVDNLIYALKDMQDNVKFCKICYNISDTDICPICSNYERNRSVICVVEDVRNFIAIENTAQYKGLYHILGGVISPVNGIGINDLNIESLITRVKNNSEIKEVIFALPTTVEGETTSLYLFKRLSDKGIQINTIARGVAFGDDLEYTDQITLGRSIINRVAYQTK